MVNIYLEKALLSITNFMTATNLGRTKVYQLIASGELETVKVGGRRLIPAEAMSDWIAKLRGEDASHVSPN